jgi:2-polyprenyl-3-methyl-5-hydroxy-6-metoxy-1,4-benzoquinol methylase
MSPHRIKYAEIAATLPEHLAAWRSLTLADVSQRMMEAREIRNRRWIEANPKTAAERDKLYVELSEIDLYKYAEWHRTDIEKQVIHDEATDWALRHSSRVLDCGGGIGDTTLILAVNGVEVTYVDLPGPCSEFARWRWRTYGCDNRVAALSPEAFWSMNGARFGQIMSIDVLEHLEDPVRHVVRYREILNVGGDLFLTAHFSHSPRNPDHLPENDAFHRIFGGEPKTARRCALTNLGFRKRRWYHYVRVPE